MYGTYIIYSYGHNITRGANLDSTCWGMVRPLHRAAACGDVGIVQALLAMGAEPNEVDVNK